jgi:hypothetical protein
MNRAPNVSGECSTSCAQWHLSPRDDDEFLAGGNRPTAGYVTTAVSKQAPLLNHQANLHFLATMLRPHDVFLFFDSGSMACELPSADCVLSPARAGGLGEATSIEKSMTYRTAFSQNRQGVS